MPVFLDTPQSPAALPGGDVIDVGLLNNLSDAGLEGGERQIFDLLTAAAGPRIVRLRLFSLPAVVRGSVGKARVSDLYTSMDDLLGGRLDGLFVTGCEPRTDRLRDEPFWPGLTEVIDWAERHTRATIWSCLAAHAAVLHLDGIERHRLPQKCSGLFTVTRAHHHALLAGADSPLTVPHSRHNDLHEADLRAAGYDILTRSGEVGVDTFARQAQSLFVFFQGHPEYDAGALLREYRRDVLRFLDGTSAVYPSLPDHYFPREIEARCASVRRRAEGSRDPLLAAELQALLGGVGSRSWNRSHALTLMRNWLDHLHARAEEHAA